MNGLGLIIPPGDLDLDNYWVGWPAAVAGSLGQNVAYLSLTRVNKPTAVNYMSINMTTPSAGNFDLGYYTDDNNRKY